MRPAWSPHTSAAGYHRLPHASPRSPSPSTLVCAVDDRAAAEPAREDGVSGLLLSGEADLLPSCYADTRTASLLDPLANLGPVELEQIALATAPSRVDSGHLLECLLDELLAQQLAECIEDDAIRDDAIRIDGEESEMVEWRSPSSR